MKLPRSKYKEIFGDGVCYNLTTGKITSIKHYNRKHTVSLEDLSKTSFQSEMARQYFSEVLNGDLSVVEDYKKRRTKIKAMLRSRKEQKKKGKVFNYRKPAPKKQRIEAFAWGDVWEWKARNAARDISVVDTRKKRDPIDIPDWLRSEAFSIEKEKELEFFSTSIPNTEVSRPVVQKMFAMISEGTERFFSYLHALKNKKDFVYRDGDKFFWDLMNLKFEGCGRAEIAMCVFIEGSRMSGGNDSFDLLINNDFYPKGYKTEVKAHFNDNGGLRIQKSKTASYFVSDLVVDTFNRIETMFSETQLWRHLHEEEIKALRDMVYDSGSISLKKRWKEFDGFSDNYLRQLQMFYFYFHDVCKRDRGVEHYLGHLPYVKDPLRIIKDLNDYPKQYFKEHSDLDDFTVFRKNDIYHCEAKDFVFDTFTDGSIKIIEKDKERKRWNYNENVAFSNYLRNPSKPFFEHYNEYLDSQWKNH